MPRRNSSDSSSDRSDYKRIKKRKRRSSSSSDSEDSDRRYHRKSSRSTSSSRSRSRERSHKRHSRSVSRDRSRKHRSSRSSSRERSYKRHSRSSSRDRSRKHRSRSHSTSRKHGSRHNSRSSRHRIRSRSKNKKSRSSSRSDSHSRSSKKSRRTRSKSHSPHRQKSSSQGSKMREDDVIKLKLQQALKAAATADAELREKGLLPEQFNQKAVNSNSVPSVADQVKRAQAIEEINSPTFTQHSFTSGTSLKQEKSIDGAGDIHTAAIFGNSCPLSSNDTVTCINNTTATTKAMREIWKNNPEKLAHENLFEDITVKTERWKKKLLTLRRRKLNGEHMM